MIRLRRLQPAHLVALALALAATVAGAGARPAHAAPAGPPPGAEADLRVIGASVDLDGAAVAVDGRALASALAYGSATTALATTAGRHRITVGALRLDVGTRAGCTTNVVAVQRPSGARPSLVAVRGCDHGRIAAGSARLTVLVASDEPGRVRATIGRAAVEVDPFEVSGPLDVPAGRATVTLAAAGADITYTSAPADLAEGTATLAVFAGGGEQPFRIFGVFDGAQAEDPPTGLDINTGLPPRRPGPPPPIAAAGLAAAAVALALAARRWGPRRAGLVLLAITPAAVGCGAAETHRDAASPRPAAVAAGGAGTAAPGASAPARAAGPPVRPVAGGSELVTAASPPAPAPVRLRIPRLGVDAPVVPLVAAQADDLPSVLAPNEVGWFRGAAPGGMGTATLAGHTGRSGVFGRLVDLATGSPVIVTDAVGHDHVFTVRRSAVYEKGHVPADVWAPVRQPRLVLVSCTGPRRPADGLHRDNVVVGATADT